MQSKTKVNPREHTKIGSADNDSELTDLKQIIHLVSIIIT